MAVIPRAQEGLSITRPPILQWRILLIMEVENASPYDAKDTSLGYSSRWSKNFGAKRKEGTETGPKTKDQYTKEDIQVDAQNNKILIWDQT